MSSNVVRQTSISLPQFTNLLSHGAILRDGSTWMLFEVESSSSDQVKSETMSIAYMQFYGSDLTVMTVLKSYTLSEADFRLLLNQFKASNAKESLNRDWAQSNRQDFDQAFRQIQTRITNGSIQKAVPVSLTFSNSGLATASELVNFLSRLVDAPPELHVYGFWNSEFGVLGATPEILFNKVGTTIRTMALAGTRKRDQITPDKNAFLNDPKELKEHNFVVNDICSVLSSIGEVTKSPIQLLQLPSLWHLQTSIVCQSFTEISSDQLMRMLHPTPALGVAPRSAGHSWMSQFPGQERRYIFGAPVCFKLPNRDLCLVSIRNLQWDSEGLILAAGCGVVGESDLEREWQEVNLKKQSVKKLFGLEF